MWIAETKRKGTLRWLVVGLSVGFLAPSARAADPSGDIKGAVDRACTWLASRQNPDGGYGPYESSRITNCSDVGITAFAVYALARNPKGYKAEDGPFLSKGLDFLLSRQQPDGGFYDTRDPTLLNYKTSVVLMTLAALDTVKYAEPIRKAREFVKGMQLSPDEGYEEAKHVTTGGFGYGEVLRPDLSNAQFSMEALRVSGQSASDELWKYAVVFVSRCQNAETVDPLLKELGIGTTGDGGFRYAPNDTRGLVETLDDGTRVFSSYGSMTYAGLKSLLYASVDKNDPRVKAAFGWISKNFTLRENPGMASKANPEAGLDGLYYYYYTMAKALSVYGEPIIKDSRGAEHAWAKELSQHLVAIQLPEGSWVNKSERWYENLKELNTSYAIVALCECQAFLKKQAAATPTTPAAAAPGSSTSSPKEPQGKPQPK
jgi:squalene-hopene/tetraprenyl-beta-curcumene cyclase